MKRQLLLLAITLIIGSVALAAPTVTSVSPGTFPRTWIGTLTVTGTGFTNGATAYVGDGITDATSGSSDMTTTFVSGTTLEVYIRCASGSILGAHRLRIDQTDGSGTLEAAFTVTTAPVQPTVTNVYFNGVTYESGLEISPRPQITAKITDPSGLSLATIDPKILIDNVIVYDNLSSYISFEAGNTVAWLFYTPATAIASSGLRNIYINAKNTSGDPGEAQCLVEIRSIPPTSDVSVVGSVLPSQNPSAPTPANPIQLQFELDAPSDYEVQILGNEGSIFKVTGSAQAGFVTVPYDGSDSLSSHSGGLCKNGIKVVLIKANGKIIGKGKIAILR